MRKTAAISQQICLKLCVLVVKRLSLGFRLLPVRQWKHYECLSFVPKTEEHCPSHFLVRFNAYSHWLSLTHTFKPIFHRAKCRSERETLAAPWWCIYGWERAKNKLYFDDSTRLPLGHYDGSWVLMRLSICFQSVGKICCRESLRIICSECVEAGMVSCSHLV